MLISPEGAATWKAVGHLLDKKLISRSDKILLLNTGSDYNQLENFLSRNEA
jgi:threonine synthase